MSSVPHSKIRVVALAIFWLVLTSIGFSSIATATPAPEAVQRSAQEILHILDYVSVDYGGVVKDGAIVDKGEYREQLEFAERLQNLTAELPAVAAKPDLLTNAQQLQQAILKHADANTVSELCNAMSLKIIEALEVNVVPRAAPELNGAATLFADNCSACHGMQGFGDGPQAATLQPPPANFHDRERQQHRSVFSLYNTISLGVPGTAMPAFEKFSNEERWKLAFYVSNFYATDSERARGEALLQTSTTKPAINNLHGLTQTTPAQLVADFGEDAAAELAYLRANPTKMQSHTIEPMQVTRDNLKASLTAYQNGNAKVAYDHAVAAYLEGFELLETPLRSVAPELKSQIEAEMMNYRQSIKNNADGQTVVTLNSGLMSMLSTAEEKLQVNQLSSSVSFLSALLIILREGVEAILVLAAMVALLIKTGRRDSLRYVHYGWISALALGFVTWYAAGSIINISGASREVTEGMTALIAAAMLIYVGFWLHKQTYAMQWQQFIHSKISQSLTNSTLTGLAVVAFLAVYREVFESILFFNTLWLQTGPSGHGYIVSGTLTAVVALLFIAWVIFKFSVRLPLKLFFRVNSIFLYILAVVFAGKGIAALQEAGMLPIDSVRFFRIDALGIYPTVQSLGVQATMIGFALLLMVISRVRFRNRARSEVSMSTHSG